MALFVVRHQHAAERCPAEDPQMGASLLNHLSRPNVRQHGVEIQGEAVVQGEHTLYLIVEARDESGLCEFMQPFQMAGSLEIYPASTCARVVASGGCTATMLPSEFVPALDPVEACQQAIDAGLVVHRAHPLNCETPIPELVGGVVMPNARFFVSSVVLRLSYQPYAEILQHFIRDGDETGLTNLRDFLGHAYAPIGSGWLTPRQDYSSYFWFAVIVLCALALLVAVLRYFQARPRANATI